jgi:uncharacterized membrane protein
MNCPKCQTSLADGAAFCSQCGARFGASPAFAPPPAGSDDPLPPALSAEAIAGLEYEVKTGEWIRRAFELTKANFAPLILGNLITGLVIGAVPLGGLIIAGPMRAGLYLHYFRVLKGKPTDYGMLFKGFNRFLPLFLGALVSGLLAGAGFMLCILPGIYLAVGYRFALHLILDQELDFWPAMEASRKLVHKRWFAWFVFGLALFGVNLLGLLACVVGLLFTAPLTVMAITLAYDDVVGIRRTDLATSPVAAQ